MIASGAPTGIPSVAATALVAEVLGLPPKVRRAVAGYLYALGKRPADHDANLRLDGRLAIPTCGVFLRDALTQHASVAAFEFLRLREGAISTADLRALGFAVPAGVARLRWVVFSDPSERRVYAEAHDALGLLGIDAPHPEEDRTPFAPFAPTTLPEPGGRPVAACCPYHTDTRPSASIYPPSVRGYGAGVCHVCRGPDGRALRFCWRRLPDGSFGARVARVQRDEGQGWNGGGTRQTTGRYNGGPTGRLGPLVRRLHGHAVGFGLRSVVTRGGSWISRAGSSILSGDVIEALIRSERTADYGNVRPRVVDHEFEAAARRELAPGRPGNADARDRLIRVQPQFSTESIVLRSGASIPSGWRDCGVQNVLLDLDGLRLGSDAAARRWANAVLGIIARDGRCSGRATVVRTSDGGAQVLVELARPIAGRLPGEAWWSTDGARSWYRALGDRMLGAAHAEGAEGGAIDWSAFSPGRLARRPGWRVTRDGTTYRARLLAACGEPKPAAALAA
jgi:hypothetical protein